MKPLCIDLFCGLGGWAEGFLSEGWDVVGFDNHRHVYGEQKYPGQLVLQDVLTLRGAQFRNASAIVASPPCQKYSYMAMPWDRAKREICWQCWERDSPFGDFHLNDLFDACFRIQREASEAAGHHIPMIVENVKGAQPWVGRARWHYGSFYLWGDVPALMPFTDKKRKSSHTPLCETPAGTGTTSWFFGNSKHEGRNYGMDGAKNEGGSWFGIGSPGQKETLQNPVNGMKGSGGGWFEGNDSPMRKGTSQGAARKAASAQIARIPPPLAEHIARVFKP